MTMRIRYVIMCFPAVIATGCVEPDRHITSPADPLLSVVNPMDDEPCTESAPGQFVALDLCDTEPLPPPGEDGLDLGFSHADCILNVTDDDDSDGLSDECEYQIARSFAPRLKFYIGEPCMRRETYWAATRTTYAEVRVIYLLGYYQDCGTKRWWNWPGWKFGPHSGDSEWIDLVAEYTEGRWYFKEATLSAHYGTPNDHTKRYGSGDLAGARQQPAVWVSNRKHANYASQSDCQSLFGDECPSPTYTSYAEVRRTRNIGSRDHPMPDPNCVRSDRLSTNREECFFDRSSHFNGWQDEYRGGSASAYYFFLADRGWLSDPLSPSPVVTLTGPQVVRPNDECHWLAVVSGGTRPYSYRWYRNGTLIGTATSYQASGTGMLLTVEVTDVYGQVDAAMLFVGTDDSAPTCWE